MKWFGYKIHLLADANYDLPVAYSITKASTPDINEAHKIIDNLQEKQPEILEKCDTFEADRGYDDTKLIKELWNNHDIKLVIRIRNMWKDGEETRLLEEYSNVVYDFKGKVYCICCKETKRQNFS